MAIICPACNASFRDPPEGVSIFGPFQCGKCEHEWKQSPPRIKMDAPSIAPELADISDKEIIRTNLPVVMPTVVVEPESTLPEDMKVFVDSIEAEPSPKYNQPFWAMGMMACTALFAGTLLFKNTIMAELPKTVPYYQAAGLASKTPGLAIENIVTSSSSKDGIRQLIVKGEVQNIADSTVPVPPLKLIMRGKTNANLYAWTVSAAKPLLKAGEKSRFTAVAHDVPTGAINVEVEFEMPAK